jgi:hypothetical protein
MSEHLARALLPPVSVSASRSERPVFPSPVLVDRALLAAAGLLFGVGLLLLWQLLTMGL